MNDSQKTEHRVETAMTADRLMKLVTHYTEACDDFGKGLFAQTAEETQLRMAKADALWKKIGAEVTRLHAEVAKSERRAIAFGDIVNSHVVAMRAAVVAAKLEGLDVGMQWIANTLCGPGHLPDLEEARALGGAQALWDKETAEHEAFRAAHPGPEAPCTSGGFHTAPHKALRRAITQAAAEQGHVVEPAGPHPAEELAMMIGMLVRALRKARPMAPQDLDYRAVNLLRKYDLLGSPLREDGMHSGGVVAPLNPPFPAKG